MNFASLVTPMSELTDQSTVEIEFTKPVRLKISGHPDSGDGKLEHLFSDEEIGGCYEVDIIRNNKKTIRVMFGNGYQTTIPKSCVKAMRI